MTLTTSTLYWRFLWILLPFSFQSHAQTPVSTWTYIEIDNEKDKWGDYQDPQWLRYFGLDAGDLNRDGFLDILNGRWVYLNPGGNMDAPWRKIDLSMNVDGILLMDVDGDAFTDVIAQALPNVYWLEAVNAEATIWRSQVIGKVPATSHTNSQGFVKAQIYPGDRQEFLIAGDGNIYCFQIPKNPESDNWQVDLVGANTSDEGIGVGDIDGDGDLDFAAGRRPEGGDEPLIVVWFENPGKASENWQDHEVGTTNHPADRIGVADLNGDRKAEIVVCEERYPGLEPDGHIFWFEQGDSLSDKWQRHRLVTQYSINNLDLKDIDTDGDIDIITSEHKGPNLELQIWNNDGEGHFTKMVVDQGKESHLGTQVYDMDGDSDLDIISTGWDQYQYVHLWRNERVNEETHRWRQVSSAKGDLVVPNSGNQQTASLVTDVNQDGAMDFFIAERTAEPSLTMFKYQNGTWIKHIIEDEPLRIEAGSASYDIDGDGDLDVVFGGESRSNEVWWWENPFPNLDPNTPWNRYTIKKSGANKHHDQIFGDFNGDGKDELVFWNQGGRVLISATIPENPKETEEWPMEIIYKYAVDSEMEPAVGLHGYPGWQSVNEHEGLAKIDIDGDGVDDIVGGGRWFKYDQGRYIENIIDASYTFSRSAAAQFVEGGRPEVLLVVGDGVGPLYMYQWHEWEGNKAGTGSWKRTLLLEELDNGHTLETLDFNGDGHWDIFSAEMRFGEGNPDARVRLLLGNGKGEFQEMVIAQGYGVHEGKMADLDGDGDLDVLGKPYTWMAPMINIWINEGSIKD